MPALDAVIKTAINRHLAAIVPDGLQQGGLLVRRTRGCGEKLFHLEPKQVANRHEPPCSHARPFGHLDGRIAPHSTGFERSEPRQRERGTEGLENKTTTIHAGSVKGAMTNRSELGRFCRKVASGSPQMGRGACRHRLPAIPATFRVD